jgi:cytochrome P450
MESASVFKKWSRQYGDMFQIRIGPSQKWIFLNSPQVVKDLLEKQSAVTSTRPNFVSARIVSNDMRLVLMPYSDKWRTLRSIIHPLLTPKASSLMEPAQEFESKQVLWDIYSSMKNTAQSKERPENEMAFYDYIRRYSASVMLAMVYGIRAPTWVSLTFPILVCCGSERLAI